MEDEIEELREIIREQGEVMLVLNNQNRLLTEWLARVNEEVEELKKLHFMIPWN